MSVLVVKREATFVMELRRAPFQITLDGAIVGTIDRHQTFETSIEPGRHILRVRTGRYASRAESFDVTVGDEVVTFRCNGARIWPVYLISIVAPSLALSLQRE